ncbi:regulator SirB [Betaproteobacteria bacterium PRO4]|uniref:SirB2 family protein n=1 Tax=Nitrosomonas sp. TaxID=42353 RepID=UPI00256A050A|nr:SirB2 family protein [Nitrosomonas sp.]MDL1865697.1 regulator SirB [Betaproteobacteria bacterium PRO4]
MMIDYFILKYLHVSCVAISYTLFVLRGTWMLTTSPRLQQRWVKVVPHVNDTVLLLSAITLAVLTHRNPLVETWLAAKIVGLLVYILLGFVAFRLGKTRRAKVTAWILAQIVFAYIVAVALTKNPFVL